MNSCAEVTVTADAALAATLLAAGGAEALTEVELVGHVVAHAGIHETDCNAVGVVGDCQFQPAVPVGEGDSHCDQVRGLLGWVGKIEKNEYFQKKKF